MLSLLYLVVRALLGLLVSAGQPSRADGSKDLEILVLRHQLRVLQRTASPPRLRTIDRALPAAASRVLPRDRWVAFLVTPPTLLRWHRELVRRKWTYRKTLRPRRPRIDAAIREPTDVRILPALAEASLAHSWSGLYEVTPDRHPIIGPVAGLAGCTW